MQPSPDAVRRVRAWVRGGLLLEAGTSWTPEPAVEPAADLLGAVRRHRVGELLATHADQLALPAGLAADLVADLPAARRAVMVQVLELARVRELLDGAGIRSLVIKGPALAVQSAGDLAARGAGDIDLLIDPGSVVAAHRVLCANGWRQRTGSEVEPGTWAWDHVLRSFNAFTYDGNGTAVDLHWRLDPTPDALPGFEAAWERRETVDVGGIAVPTLSPPDALAHTCLHAAKDSWRWLRSLVDIHRLARHDASWGGDAPEGLRRLEVEALALTRSCVGLPPNVPAEVLARLDRVHPAFLARASRAQERPVHAAIPFPGVESLRLMHYMVRASSTRRDLVHAVVGTALPVKAVVGVESRSGWTGVPVVLGHRLRRLGRRGLAWARREPGAGVVDSVIKVHR